MLRHIHILIFLAAAALAVNLPMAAAQDQKVLVTVNDQPITSYDLTARINLWKLLGRAVDGKDQRKKALDSIIDDIAKIEEAKKYRAQATEKEIQERLSRMAKGMKTDETGLASKLKQGGVTMTELRRYIEAQIAFNRILAGKYKEKITVSDAEVDAKLAEFKQQVNSQLAKIKADPRMQPITVYQLLDISFPVDSPDLLQSRFAEAMQYSQQFKGCKSARAAASGIFNVRIGKTVEADGRKLPPQMKAAFSKAGSNKAIGPFRNKSGLQLWALCGTRKITPQLPKADLPNRDQVKNVLLNQKYDEVEKRYGRQFRESLLIEYRDQTYAN